MKETKNDGMKFLYTNADQFVNKRDDLLARIAGDEPDIIMITEVIPKSQKNPIAPALLEIDGYKPTFNFEPKSDNLSLAGIRGVAIYSKMSLNASEVDDIKVDDFSDHVWIEIPQRNEPLLIGCIYRSPSNDINKEACTKSATVASELIKSAYTKESRTAIIVRCKGCI